MIVKFHARCQNIKADFSKKVKHYKMGGFSFSDGIVSKNEKN